METPRDFFQQMYRQLDQGKPFVAYAKPGNHRLVGLFQQNGDTYILKDFAETGFVLAPFDGNRRYFIPDGVSETVMTTIEATSAEFRDSEPATDAKAKERFEDIVSKGIFAINVGAFKKVVLSRKEAVAIDSDAISIFERLAVAYPTAFRYFWFHPETGIWMGATPEQLIKIKDNQFNTVALAGTQPFLGKDEVEWQEKEMAEQQFVTDFISESLMSSATGVTFSDPYTAKAGNLLHIKTDIEGTLAGESGLGQIVEVLHPTPAVCGFPKAESKKFILENEGYDREFYSGYLGELNKDFANDKKATEFYVNLRCMKITGKTAELFMGCGITKDSTPEKEFVETVNKSLTMKRML